MKISQELIIRELKEEIQDFSVTFSEGADFSTMKLSGICSIDEETKIRNGTLYLIDPGCDVLKNAKIIQSFKKTDAVICCLGKMEEEIIDCGVSYICMIKNNTINDEKNSSVHHLYHHIFHIIYDIFQKYESWKENLYQAIENADLQEMLDASLPIFRRSIYLADDQPEYLAASGPCLDYGGSGSQIPLEVFNYLKNDVNNNQPLSDQEPFIYPEGILNADALCQDVFLNSDYFGRIIIIDELSHTAFTPGEFKLMNILSNALQLLINQNYPALCKDKENSDNSNLISLINQILLDQRIDKSQLNSVLIRNGWQKNEGCYIGYLLLYPSNVQIKSSLYYCRYITQKFPGVYAIEKNDHLILIIRESIYPAAKEFIAKFILFIRDCNFRFGISNLCADLTQLSCYCHQAEIALNYGMQKNETIWCHWFSDYAFAYLLREASHEMPAELLCAPELITLQNYDKVKKSDYYETLKTYLDNKMNAAQTAKQLFIHQATMVYRLKRLKELTGIDYEDSDQMLYLHLSYKILEIS